MKLLLTIILIFFNAAGGMAQTVDAVATTKLNRKKDKQKPGLLGNNYRKEWATEIKDVPVFDLEKEKGGLKILQRGGGLQTRSLRLEDSEGRQYGLRSIEKFPEKAVPLNLQGTLAADLVTDQVSASHPYAAFVIPKLADAADVYHTNPVLVYLPDDPNLGVHREDFGGGLFLFEERPAGEEWRELESFGKPDDIISTLDLVEKIQKNDKHIVDQMHVLRSRLFDIWIGDWDRHDDQWRWARFDQEDDFKIYRPIPRDRDQAFFWADGKLIKLISHKWGQPKFQGFHNEIRDVEGLGFNARYFDRTFLTGPSLSDWLDMAKDLQVRLTDEVIESSIKEFPNEIYELNGDIIIEKLKKRRDDLHIYAREFYLFLAEKVDILGSDKAELFQVKRVSDEETSVKVFRIKEGSGEVKHQIFERVFKTSETDEIRLYGFGDDDRFEIDGKVKDGIKVRIVGGKGDDIITDNSLVSGMSKKTIVYDDKSNVSAFTNELKDKTSTKVEGINTYDRYAFKYDKVLPLLAGGFNPDDGIFVGGGVSFLKHGFRKEPFSSKHTFTASIAPKSASYNFKYVGQFTNVIRKWGVDVEADIFEPSFADFFYGFGNKTISDEDLREDDTQAYRARYSQWILRSDLVRKWNEDTHTFRIGGFYRSVEIGSDQNNQEPNRFLISYADAIGRGAYDASPLLDTRRNYIGVRLNYVCDLTDLPHFPTKGIRFHINAKSVTQVGLEENTYQSIGADLSSYLTIKGNHQTTLALRVGGQANFGDFEFYQAPRLGGLHTLRGYRRARFAGDESFYQNTDLRTKLFDFNTILFPGSFGITLIHDVGRVWTNNPDEFNTDESLEDWHRGYGGGVWISPLGQAVISADYTVSNNSEHGVFVRLGFLF
ncbi:MAG: hypothetical protein Tsb0034_05030 [Ekhidna sp.]